MSRKRTSLSTNEIPNPLQRMLGTYLRVERRRLGVDTATTAELLGLTDTYYRLVESGGAPLNQSLVLKLVDFFSTRSATATSTPIRVHFQRLALYLVGSHWVGAEMANLGGKEGADLQAMELLSQRDEDFALFHQRTKRYYSLQGDQLKSFLQDDAASHVAGFLGTLVYARPTKENLIEQVFSSNTLLAMPTLNVEMVRRLITDLSGRPFVHTTRVASEWEYRMASTFKSVVGVYAHKGMIVNPQNLTTFLYPYLRERSCREVRFVFLEQGDPQSTKRDFLKELNSARKAAGQDIVGKEDAEKLRIAFAPNVKKTKMQTLAQELFSRTIENERILYDAYWSFDTTSEVPIGFVGTQRKAFGDTWNLNLQESLSKRTTFEQLWSEACVNSD